MIFALLIIKFLVQSSIDEVDQRPTRIENCDLFSFFTWNFSSLILSDEYVCFPAKMITGLYKVTYLHRLTQWIWWHLMRCNDEMSNELKMVTCIKLSQIIITEHNRHDFDCLHKRAFVSQRMNEIKTSRRRRRSKIRGSERGGKKYGYVAKMWL